MRPEMSFLGPNLLLCFISLLVPKKLNLVPGIIKKLWTLWSIKWILSSIATFHPSINLAPRYFISPVQTYRLVHRQLTNYPNLIIDLRLRLRAWKIFINKTFLFLGPSSCWTRKPLNFFEVLMTVFVSLLDLKSFEKWIGFFFSVWSIFFCAQLFLEVHFN